MRSSYLGAKTVGQKKLIILFSKAIHLNKGHAAGRKGIYIYIFQHLQNVAVHNREGSFPTMTLEINPDLTPLKACHPCFKAIYVFGLYNSWVHTCNACGIENISFSFVVHLPLSNLKE